MKDENYEVFPSARKVLSQTQVADINKKHTSQGLCIPSYTGRGLARTDVTIQTVRPPFFSAFFRTLGYISLYHVLF